MSIAATALVDEAAVPSQQSDSFLLARRSTDEACERLGQTRNPLYRNPWYEPGTDFCYYVHAHNACRSSKMRLRRLNLSAREEQLLKTTEGVNVALDKLRQIQEQEDNGAMKSSVMKHASSFTNGFSEFMVKISGIVQTLLPQSPEYTVTYGVLLIIFKAVITKKDRQESISRFIFSLSNRLPVVGFYREVFPTNALKVTVASIYAGLMSFLDEVLIYYRSGRFGKIIDAVIQPAESKFEKHIKDIELSIEKMNSLKDAAHVAQQNDMQELLKDTGHVVARMFQNFECAAVAMGSSIAMIDQKIDVIRSQTEKFLEIEAFKYALSLRQVLSSDEINPQESFVISSRGDLQLSPKDRWENNGILDDLLSWSMSGRNSLFWIGGSSGNQDSWVTDFSLDMIQAFQAQSPILLYALCNNLPSSQFLTPRSLIKSLITQLLTSHPNLAFQNPELCNQHRFAAATTFGQLWSIFVKLAIEVPELFIVVDRVEQCRVDEDADLSHQLLPSLVELAGEGGHVSVIVTSIYDPPDGFGEERLKSVYIDTGKRAKRRK